MKFLEIGGVVFSWLFWILVAVLACSGLFVSVMILAAVAREVRRKQEQRRKDGDE